MGDAGPLNPDLDLGLAKAARNGDDGLENLRPSIREVKILVTGFGQFKSFIINPSWLIARALPSTLMPPPLPPISSEETIPSINASASGPANLESISDIPFPKSQDYKITIVTHPAPVRVSYATAATLIPQLIQQHDPDYVLHIGMAAGREHYTLETIAHRDNYKIKDVDERNGWKDGEAAWKQEGVPEKLSVGWDAEDVLRRWEETLERLKEEEAKITAASGVASSFKERSKKNVVKLSRDAGRFLCEFALFESLSRRWSDAQSTGNDDAEREKVKDRVGKVAFLHVPGGYNGDDIRRGAIVAESAIRALVESWEAGFRRKEGQEQLGVVSAKALPGGWEGLVWKA